MYAEGIPRQENKEMIILETWSIYLVRLVTKLGKHLISHPSSIFHLVPPFCPLDTGPLKQFAASTRGIAVIGLTDRCWDDCVSTTASKDGQFTALAYTSSHYACSTDRGVVTIYDATTCEGVSLVFYGEVVRILLFSHKSDLLISGGT